MSSLIMKRCHETASDSSHTLPVMKAVVQKSAYVGLTIATNTRASRSQNLKTSEVAFAYSVNKPSWRTARKVVLRPARST